MEGIADIAQIVRFADGDIIYMTAWLCAGSDPRRQGLQYLTAMAMSNM